MPAYVDTMAYAGDVPWHRMGNPLSENATGDVMLREAGLDWTVEKVPAYYLGAEGVYRPIPGQYTLQCSDTGTAIPTTVGAKYVPFQNAQLIECMEALRSQGDVRFHTAGSLMERTKVWALAQLAGEQIITRRNGNRDVSAPFILGHSSHDGSSSISYRLTSVRVVCWNTLSAALREKGMPEFRCRHTASAADRMEEAAKVLGLAEGAIERQTATLQQLADEPMGVREFVAFAAQLLTGEDEREKALAVLAKAEGRSRAQYERKGNTLVQLFVQGQGNYGDCKLDALNAVTEYVDHQRNRAGDWRNADTESLSQQVDSQLFGLGERIKARAQRLLVGVAA